MKKYETMTNWELNVNMALCLGYDQSRLVQYPHNADGVSLGVTNAATEEIDWFNYVKDDDTAISITQVLLPTMTPVVEGKKNVWHVFCRTGEHASNESLNKALVILYLKVKGK